MTERIITDIDGATLKVADYHGHFVQPFPGIGDRIDALRNLTVRDDDVVIVGYPKSGNHWAWELAIRILTENTGEFQDYIADVMIEARTDKFLRARPSPRVLLTHFPAEILSRAEKLFNGKTKLIYVIRNPKDVAVSYYIQTHSFYTLYGYNGTWKGYFELFLNGTVDSGSWFDHVTGWERYRSQHADIPIHFVYYEDLKQNLMEEIKKLGDFLGVSRSDDFYEKIFRLSQFDAMKRNHDAHAPKVLRNQYRKGDLTMLRKGIIGDWKNYFTVSQSEHFNLVYAERMRESKLNIRFLQSQM